MQSENSIGVGHWRTWADNLIRSIPVKDSRWRSPTTPAIPNTEIPRKRSCSLLFELTGMRRLLPINHSAPGELF
jgi:hypothetical protein